MLFTPEDIARLAPEQELETVIKKREKLKTKDGMSGKAERCFMHPASLTG